MRSSNVIYLLLSLSIVAAQSSSSSRDGSSTTATSTSSPTSTRTIGSRIVYTSLSPCVSSCISSAVSEIPCTPFVASCFCVLPTGRISYMLPEECVKSSCGSSDITSESAWRSGVCADFSTITTSPIGIPTGGAFTDETGWKTATVSSDLARETENCAGGVACPIGLNGGCCPSGNDCNLFDCQPQTSTPLAGQASVTVSSEIPYITLTDLFPPCSYSCIADYLPRTSCGLSPLNSTCFCRLHDMFPCFSSCSADDLDAFVKKQMDICQDLWYFTPYDQVSSRWCDLSEGGGDRGRPWGYDVRLGSLGNKCPNWWEVKTGGQRFGICLGIGVASYIAVLGCCGFWKRIGRRVDKLDRKNEMIKRQLMGLS